MLILRAASWNLAAVNNNPFEYWTTIEDPAYLELMKGVEDFLSNPERDVLVSSIFSECMFEELLEEMKAQQMDGLDELEKFWTNDFRNRMAIKGFLKDKMIGMKRLASMPDRITNTINLKDGSICTRPTVINAYDGSLLESLESWWRHWKIFMFHTQLQIFADNTSDHQNHAQTVCSLLSPIMRGKYPAITVEEQAISVQLQILCLAILDSIFVHILNVVAPFSWQAIRTQLCEALIKNKASKSCEIIAKSYRNTDVFFIQEAAAIFVEQALQRPEIQEKYNLLLPQNLDGKRDQNSLILVDRKRFRRESCVDITQQVVDSIDGTWVAAGDLLAVSIEDSAGARWMLVSFHGDSNGLSTQPLISAVSNVAREKFRDHILLVGLDANTYSHVQDAYHHSVESFSAFVEAEQMVSMWGPCPDPSIRTTCSSRTYLQTQLQKATSWNERASVANQNLRDWILAYRCQIDGIYEAARDNTGLCRYIDGMVLPTLSFPSDHAIVSAALHVKGLGAAVPPYPSAEQPKPPSALPGAAARCGIQRERTLYDHWGIAEKPVAFREFGSSQKQMVGGSSADDALAGLDVDPAEAVRDATKVICEQHFVRRALDQHVHDLDTKMKFIFSKGEDRSIWILFSSRPFSIAICKRWFQYIVIITGVLFLLSGLISLMSVVSFATLQGRHFRFTPLAIRSKVIGAISSPRVGAVGLLQGGCKVRLPSNVSVSGASMLVSFESVVAMDGWWFETAHQPLDDDPVRFLFEQSDDGVAWQAVPTPSWMPAAYLQAVPTARGADKLVDLRAPWQWIVSQVLSSVCFAVGCVVACAWGAAGHGRRGTIAWAACYCVLFALTAVYACSTAAAGAESILAIDPYTAAGLWTNCLSNLVQGIILYTERYLLDLFTLSFFVAAMIDLYPFIMETPATSDNIGAIVIFAAWNVIPVLLGWGLLIARNRTQKWVFGPFVEADRRVYDDVWSNLTSIQAEQTELRGLADLARRIQESIAGADVRQRHRPRPLPKVYSLEERLSNFAVRLSNSLRVACIQSHTVEASTYCPLVTSLDQLFDQGSSLDIFLRKKACDLALVSSGCFPTLAGSESGSQMCFARVSPGSKLADVNWASIKSSRRAMEKLLRSYDCDVSRLLDCCRQTIVFERTQYLAQCLEAMAHDPEIEILRLKNRLDPEFDSTFSGGFRNVIVNLRIQSPDTMRLGLDTHICELQLTLKCFAELMTKDRHSRYIVLRNCRGAPTLGTLLSDVAAQCRITGRLPSTSCLGGLFRRRAAIEPDDSTPGPQVVIEAHSVQSEHQRFRLGNSSAVHSQNRDLGSWLSLDAERHKMLEEQFLSHMTSTTRYSAHYRDQSRWRKDMVEIAVARAASGSVWDTSHPFAAALCQRWMWILLLLLLASSVVGMALHARLVQGGNSVGGRRFRFTALERRGGGAATSPGIQSFGIMQNGCRDGIERLLANVSVVDASIVLTFVQQVEMNGWWIETSSGSVLDDPVRFRLERSIYGEQDVWQKTSSSSTSWTWAGTVVMSDGYYATSQVRNATIAFDLEAPLTWAVQRIGTTLVVVVMCLLLFLVILTKNQMSGRWIAAASFALCFVINGAAAISYLVQGHGAIAMVSGCFSAIDLGFAVAFAFSEKYLRHWAGGVGAAKIVVLVIEYNVLLVDSFDLIGVGGISILANTGFLDGLVFIISCLCAFATRRQSTRKAHQIIAKDQQAYDCCWEALVQDEKANGVLARINSYTSEVKSQRPSVIHQRAVLTASQELKPGAGQMVASLDQLFVQAAGLDVFLKDKVRDWGVSSRGWCQVVTAGAEEGRCACFRRWDDVVKSPDLVHHIKWAKLKTYERAIEKLYRCYNLEVSRLLDCCRQSIYFEDLESLLDCFKRIVQDEAVQVMRINNKLRLDYDSRLTAGYRDLSMNLSIVNDDTRRLCLHTGICELQLVLISFAKIKTDEGHARYVEWRNQRGR